MDEPQEQTGGDSLFTVIVAFVANFLIAVGPGRVFLVAAIDLTGDQREHDLAVRLRRMERELESRDSVEEAVLTLSTADEPSLVA